MRWAISAAAVAAVALGILVLVASQHYTACYASFRSPEDAHAVATSAETLGYDADVESQKSHTSITVSSGESGDDAETFIADFEDLIDDQGGTLAEDGGSCQERQRFE